MTYVPNMIYICPNRKDDQKDFLILLGLSLQLQRTDES